MLVAEDGSVYDAPAPKGVLVNAVGSGDSMVAGFTAGWMEKRDYRHAFYMGVAAGKRQCIFGVSRYKRRDHESVSEDHIKQQFSLRQPVSADLRIAWAAMLS